MTWICPKCERELKNEKQTHYCAKVNLDSLFEGKSAELVLAFDKLLLEVADWDDVAISTTPNCVVFVHNQTFLVVKPMKAALDVKFYSMLPLTDLNPYKSLFYSGRYANHFRISKVEELTPLIFRCVKESYELL
ncbi:DUF5655 domain-containing protein [Mucilaginibacter flavus]|uniref:DUF5655 domain-containing protein n=1 Tax=Mucilaginibacter flavus TaxID=931504 RepID=UPI0025B33FE0|nr:DUF5655 domain-containing protein [Mucilaginibacter flavus]MDN3582423.1 DUF5655 domain-containing protein [Mucilaginibacter flavus]